MRTRRRIVLGTAAAVASLATVVAAGAGVWALSASTDAALRARSAPSGPAGSAPSFVSEPTVLGTQAVVPRSTAPHVTLRAKPRPPLMAPGSTGRQVRELQARLSQLAWFTPPMTGTYDRETRVGVRGFQDKRGFAASGAVDARTWKRLVRMTQQPSGDVMFNRAGPALFERGDTGTAVRRIQARLRQLAWYFGNVTDTFGDQTAASVRGFQAKRGIPVTGKVDRRTLDLLTSMTRTPTAGDLANRRPDPADGRRLDARCRTGVALCIDKTGNSLRYVVNGKVRTSLDVRFGAVGTPTREGVFSVYRKSRDHISSLYDSAMPFAMFFSGGQAVHYSSDFAARGYSGASHGCVNVRDYTALASLYDQVPIGTKVVVYRS